MKEIDNKYFELLKTNPLSYKDFPEEVKKNPTVIERALCSDIKNIEYIPEEIRSDRGFILDNKLDETFFYPYWSDEDLKREYEVLEDTLEEVKSDLEEVNTSIKELEKKQEQLQSKLAILNTEFNSDDISAEREETVGTLIDELTTNLEEIEDLINSYYTSKEGYEYEESEYTHQIEKVAKEFKNRKERLTATDSEELQIAQVADALYGKPKRK